MMRAPRPTRLGNDREVAAFLFACAYVRLFNLTNRCPAAWGAVCRGRYAYRLEILRDEARASDLWRMAAEKRAEATWNLNR